jgi:hypothetical protein
LFEVHARSGQAWQGRSGAVSLYRYWPGKRYQTPLGDYERFLRRPALIISLHFPFLNLSISVSLSLFLKVLLSLSLKVSLSLFLMVLLSISWFCSLSHGFALYLMVLLSLSHGFALSISHGLALSISHDFYLSCAVKAHSPERAGMPVRGVRLPGLPATPDVMEETK